MKKWLNLYYKKMIKDPLVNKLLSIDSTFQKKGNIYYAENAFMVNSVVRVLRRLATEKKLTEKKFQFYCKVLYAYINGQLVLYWEGNKLYARQLEKENKGE